MIAGVGTRAQRTLGTILLGPQNSGDLPWVLDARRLLHHHHPLYEPEGDADRSLRSQKDAFSNRFDTPNTPEILARAAIS